MDSGETFEFVGWIITRLQRTTAAHLAAIALLIACLVELDTVSSASSPLVVGESVSTSHKSLSKSSVD